MSNPPVSGPSILSNRFAQTIIVSALFLQIGVWVRNIAILFYVIDMTGGDSLAVSFISVAEYAPIFIFSFIGGTLAKRWRPKKTMVRCDLLSAASILGVLFAMENGSWKAVFFATLVSAILSQFTHLSGMKLFKLHVPEHLVQKGMSVYQTLYAVFMIFGPIVGTFVYRNFGIETSIGIMGASFLISAALLAILPSDRQDDGEKQNSHILEDVKAEYRYVRSSILFRKLGGVCIAAGLGLGLIQPLAIFLMTERLGRAENDLQWFLLVNGVTMIIGGAMAMSLEIIGSGLSTEYWLTLGLQFISGFLFPFIHIGMNTKIMRNRQESFIGRVNRILTPLLMGSIVVTMMLSGIVKNAISLVPLYAVAGLFFLAGLVIIIPLFMIKSGIPLESGNTASR
ncbi:MFS transporter [Cohnella herbarum]|uniref:MFS transporter n=1 Tax=Cohnella herbarum TaxID=2728023 RepID=A0A7Z2ZNP0_9BACL|nr:MFS transporter [Cohnella herbarum]QJD86646.1 MFS transporter [Cohnella herbarum]